MAVGQRLSLRCFLEGIEVPIISASLAIQLDAPAQCQIQLPATDAILKLKPRTLVHVFYYDLWDGPSDSLSTKPSEASEQQAVTTKEADAARRGEEDWTPGAGSTGLNSPNMVARSTDTTTNDGGVVSSD